LQGEETVRRSGYAKLSKGGDAAGKKTVFTQGVEALEIETED
jgi:hypothetical protein